MKNLVLLLLAVASFLSLDRYAIAQSISPEMGKLASDEIFVISSADDAYIAAHSSESPEVDLERKASRDKMMDLLGDEHLSQSVFFNGDQLLMLQVQFLGQAHVDAVVAAHDPSDPFLAAHLMLQYVTCGALATRAVIAKSFSGWHDRGNACLDVPDTASSDEVFKAISDHLKQTLAIYEGKQAEFELDRKR